MDANKWRLIVILMIGGLAVLGSYLWGVQTRSDAGQILWGRVPEIIRPFYTVNMLLAAVGYFLFTFFILFRLESEKAKAISRFGYAVFQILYLVILIPSALWLPLTFLAVDQSSRGLLWLVRVVLIGVGAALIGVLLALRKVRPPQPTGAYRLALAGSIFFCIQTVILDAMIWAAFFRL